MQDVVFEEFSCLTDEEVKLLKRTVDGDVQAAGQVASWMFGTIDTPEPNAVVWKWRLRRTTQRAESVFLGQWPNPMKPMRVVTSIDRDGNWRACVLHRIRRASRQTSSWRS